MAQSLSEDPRIRAIGAIEAACRARPRRCGVSNARAVRRMDEYPRTGGMAPKSRGGDRRSGRIEAPADPAMPAVEDLPDGTPAEPRSCGNGGARRDFRARHDRRRRPPPRHPVQEQTAQDSEPAREDAAARRDAWCELRPELDPLRLVVIDATGATARMARRRGRSPRGALPHGHCKTTTPVAGLRPGGLAAPMVISMAR